MFDGKVEIRRYFDNMVIMTGLEDEKLLKLKGTSAWVHNYAYLSHHDKGILSSNILWHAIFGHINYDSLHMMNKNVVSGLPTIIGNLQQCKDCILGKHNKKHFYDSTSRALRKLDLMHSDIWCPMLVPSTSGNIYIMNFIDDYTRMSWVYLLKNKSQAFENFKKFHMYIKNETQSCIGTLRTDNGGG
jgi:hypothetical protein